MAVILSIFDLIPLKIGGIEHFAKELSRQLGALGHRSILCFAEPLAGDVRRFFDLPNVEVEVLRNQTSFSRRLTSDFATILRKYRPDVIQTHYGSFLGPMPWTARLHGVRKYFFSDRGGHAPDFVPRRVPAPKRYAAQVLTAPITGVISVSEYNRRCMQALGTIAPHRVFRVYNGVEVGSEHASAATGQDFRARFGIPADCPLIVQVGLVTAEKGADTLIEAAAIFARERKAHFALVGGGSELDRYRQLIAERGLSQAVTLTGIVSKPIEAGVYAAADVICLLSRVQESFGFVIAEAMICGKPVIASAAGAFPELVQDGETGFLVERGDGAAVADRIRKLLEDRSLAARMGQAGRVFARREFDLSTNVRKIIDLYGL